MRIAYLRVRCGPYRILVPGDNITSIEEGVAADVAAVSIRQARRRGWPLVMDARVLLGLDPVGTDVPRINIHWHSNDGRRRAVLGVDGVDGLRDGEDADVLTLPRVPSHVRALFDGLLCDGGDGFLLQLRRDVRPPLDTMRHRRGFVRAVLGALPPPGDASNRMET